MSTAAEGAQAKQGSAAAIASGLNQLSENDKVFFKQYVRYVLPSDGTVFWVETATTFSVQGSFHYSTEQRQNEAETEGRNTVVFSAIAPIQQFNSVAPDTLWIGTYPGDVAGYDQPITFAFSARGRYYQAMDEYHYVGTAVLPTLATQLVTSEALAASVVQATSTSMPLWLAMNGYVPPYDNGIKMPLTMYSSYLVPDNLAPPYAVVHIDPESTESLSAAPMFNQLTSQYQLCRDHVRITLYGANNSVAEMFLAAVFQYSYDYDTVGLASTPSFRDGKKSAPELNAIAMMKTLAFDVNYYQSAVRNIAAQQIKTWINHYLPQPLSATGFVPPAP